MDVEGIERVANLMSDTGREQCERTDSLALDSFECLLTRFSRIVQN